MHWIDITIIVAYLLLMIAVGWIVAKLAARSPDSYFLAGKSLPWWVIGVAHGSSGIDITGTMWFAMMLFIYGVRATWLLWVWPLFNVIFRMMYLGVWVRRSNVLTGAEWMRTRFGFSRGAELAYLSVVLYALVSVVGFLSYAFRGIGEFAVPFFPWQIRPETYGTIILLITGIYCVVGGMYSVVLNDLIQYALILVAGTIIAGIAMARIAPEQITAIVPTGWDNFWPGWKLDLDWAAKGLPAIQERIFGPKGDGYSLFGFFVTMLFVKGVAVSMAGPTPNYAIQHILSTRSPREAALENMWMAVVSLGPRFLMIAGITAIGLVFFLPEMQSMKTGSDAEKILPVVVVKYLPIGAKGLILAALLAAFMSTFVSTVNSGAAYVVNDIYKRYVNPQAPVKRLVLFGYLCSIAVIFLGIGFGFATKHVHSVTEWIVSALVPAFVAPNVLKWHWWRFNGYGFFAGMIAGTAAALGLPYLKLHPITLFMSILAISTAASMLVCFLTAPEDMSVLREFYRTVRPWGFWGPVYSDLRQEDPSFEKNHDFWRDMFNLAVGLVWQVSMVTLPIYLVIKQWGRTWLSLATVVISSLILKFTWYDKLGKGDGYLVEPKEEPAVVAANA